LPQFYHERCAPAAVRPQSAPGGSASTPLAPVFTISPRTGAK
jgi:hypothetical protein